MDTEKSIKDRLSTIAERFLKTAETTTNPKTALSSLSVVEKTLDLGRKLEPDLNLDSVRFFLSLLNPKVFYDRADLWRSYLKFCEDGDFDSTAKGLFFSKLGLYDFKIIETGDRPKIKAPANRQLLLDGAEELAQELGIAIPQPKEVGGIRRRGRG